MLEGDLANGVEGQARVVYRLLPGEADLEVGAVDRAADAIEEIPDSLGIGLVKTFFKTRIHRLQGKILARQGRGRAAEQLFMGAIEDTQQLPYDRARLLSSLALLHTEQGQGEKAGAELDEALDIFRQLGAGREVARTERMVTLLTSGTTSASGES